MSHKKNNRIFVILIIVICIVFLSGSIYKYIHNNKDNTAWNDMSNSQLPKPAPFEVQSLIELQRDKGPSAILDVDCLLESTTDAKNYCLDSQNILKQIYSK